MDLTNFEELHAKHGERNSTNSEYFWNGSEWQKDMPFFDFSLSRDWLLLAVCLFIVGLGVSGLIALI